MPPGAGISERILVCPFQLVVADTAAGVLESLSFLGDEFPGVFPGQKRQFQYAERFPIPHLAVWGSEAEQAVAAPARPDDDFADAVFGVGVPIGILRREPLIGMFMPCKNQIGAGRIE